MPHVCVCCILLRGQGPWLAHHRAVSQGSPLQLTEGDTGVRDKQNFKGNQEK